MALGFFASLFGRLGSGTRTALGARPGATRLGSKARSRHQRGQKPAMQVRFFIKDQGQTLRNIDKILRRPRKILKGVGDYLVAKNQAAYQKQGFAGSKWAARSTPSVGGILQDLSRGTILKSSRFKARPVLIDTGRMSRSYVASISRSHVSLTNTAPYAGIQQDGETVVIPITDTIKRNLKWSMRLGVLRTRELRNSLAWIASRSQVSVTPQARKVIEGIETKADDEAVSKIVMRVLRGN